MSKSYEINEEMVSDYTEVLVLFLCERDPTTILLAKDHAPEKKELFCAKIKVSAFVNFEVDRLKKMKKSAVLEFPGTVVYSGGFYLL